MTASIGIYASMTSHPEGSRGLTNQAVLRPTAIAGRAAVAGLPQGKRPRRLGDNLLAF
jgi:hypothetical protein